MQAKVIDGVSLTELTKSSCSKQCTGRSKLLSTTPRCMILLCGRRAGKDRFLSAVAVWRAALCADWRLEHISAGEQAVSDSARRRQATSWDSAALRRWPAAGTATRDRSRAHDRRGHRVPNGASLEISTNDARLVRGRSAIAVLGSEASHWRTDEHAASSDEEVVGAAEPSMAMCPDAGLLMLGSQRAPETRYMYRKYRELFGNDASEAICWFAPSTLMNPKLPVAVIDKALAEDAARVGPKYLNLFGEDLSDFIPSE